MNRAKRIIKPEPGLHTTLRKRKQMSTTIELTAADGHTLAGYAAGPENATRGLVVLQEIFGVNHHIRVMADSYAAAGYKVIAPAPFDRVEKNVELGYGPDDRKRGVDIRGQITDEQALADILAAAKALNVKKVGVVGYCWGGTLSWLAATKSNVFSAASCWYGGGIAANKDAKPNCPVQMHFGETDGSISLAAIDEIKAAQPQVEVYVYAGAGHGFGCADRDSFNKEAYDLAQQRTLAFFAKHLA
jgi:carboxymethylenebutenolidase